MLENNFISVYDKFKLHFYQAVYNLVKDRDGSLSAMETFALEVIYMLGEPTVGQFADFLNISQSNATYKVNSLMKKGYIERQNSTSDRREYHLILSEKFYAYHELMTSYVREVMQRVERSCAPEEVAAFDRVLSMMTNSLMPECDKR